MRNSKWLFGTLILLGAALVFVELSTPAANFQTRLLAVKLVTNVAAGDDKTLTVPALEQWRVLAVLAENTTTATVGNRRIIVEFRDGAANVLARATSAADQAASLTNFFTFAPGMAAETAFTNSTITRPIPPDILLPATYTVRVRDLTAVDTADTLRVRVLVEVMSEGQAYVYP